METNTPSEAILMASLPFPIKQKECPELYAAASVLSRNLPPDDPEDIYDLLMDIVVILLESPEKRLSAQDALLELLHRELHRLDIITQSL